MLEVKDPCVSVSQWYCQAQHNKSCIVQSYTVYDYISREEVLVDPWI